MRIAIASSSRLALPLLEAIAGAGHAICGIITTPDAPKGRGREITESEFARALSSQPISKPATNGELVSVLETLEPELVVTVAYGRLIKNPALVLPSFGWINLHFSLLPAYRGAAPVQRALLDGVSTTGVTVFKLDAGMDTGPIFTQSEVQLRGDETSGELLDEMSRLGAKEVLKSIEMISQGILPTVQSGPASFAPKILKSETRVDWSAQAESIERMVRAFQPTPGAWTTFRDERITITAAGLVEGAGSAGAIISIDPLVIACGQGALLIKRLQSGGRRELDASEWVRGARLPAGARFE